jgi:hypothetical protein
VPACSSLNCEESAAGGSAYTLKDRDQRHDSAFVPGFAVAVLLLGNLMARLAGVVGVPLGLPCR